MSCDGYECPGREGCRDEMDRLDYEADLQECHEYALYYEAEMERLYAEMVKESEAHPSVVVPEGRRPVFACEFRTRLVGAA